MNATDYSPTNAYAAHDVVHLRHMDEVHGKRLQPFAELANVNGGAWLGMADGVTYGGNGTIVIRSGALGHGGRSAAAWIADGSDQAAMQQALARLLGNERTPAKAIGMRQGPATVSRVKGRNGRSRTVRHEGIPLVVVEAGGKRYHYKLGLYRYLCRHLRECTSLAVLVDSVFAFRCLAFLDPAGAVLAMVCPVTMPTEPEGTPRERLDAFTKKEQERREAAKQEAAPIPAGAAKVTKAELLRAISARGCALLGAPHRRSLADVVADCLSNDRPETEPCPTSTKGQRIERTLPDGRVSSAELDRHCTAYRIGRHIWLAWSEYPAERGQPAHAVGLVYRVP